MIKKIGNGNDLTVSIGGMIFTSQFEKEFSDIPFVLFSISAVHSNRSLSLSNENRNQ